MAEALHKFEVLQDLYLLWQCWYVARLELLWKVPRVLGCVYSLCALWMCM